jgi:hypothetical protein
MSTLGGLFERDLLGACGNDDRTALQHRDEADEGDAGETKSAAWKPSSTVLQALSDPVRLELCGSSPRAATPAS